MPCSLLALSASTRYEKPLQQHDTLLNYSRVVASGRGEVTSCVDCTHIQAGASSAAWLITLFLSFTLSFLTGYSPVPRVTTSSLALAASPTAVRALTCHWPCPPRFGRSVPRLPTRSFIHGSSFQSIFHSLLLFLLFLLSPNDSRVYSRAFIVH